jgi:DNA-binding PadR family transcriptional regulator
MEPRITREVIKVFAALMSAGSDGELPGSEISRATTLASGTLYPILLRLEKAGWLASRWEEGDPSVLGRPRRRFYRITATGGRQMGKQISEIKSLVGGLAWAQLK